MLVPNFLSVVLLLRDADPGLSVGAADCCWSVCVLTEPESLLPDACQ